MQKRKRLNEFLRSFVRLAPEHGAGVVTLLGISLLEADGKVRSSKLVMNELIEGFSRLSTSRQRELVKLVKQAEKGKGKSFRKRR